MKNTYFTFSAKFDLSKAAVKAYLLENAEDMINFFLRYKADDVHHYMDVTKESLVEFIRDGGLMLTDEEEETNGED